MARGGGIEVAQAFVTIIPSMKGSQDIIAKELGAEKIGTSAGQKLGAAISGGLGKAAKAIGKAFVVGTTAAAAGITALTVQATKAYSEYEQLAGGAKQIFSGIDYNAISLDAQAAYKTMGMSANEYLESINTTGAAFKATMGDAKGYETAKKGMKAISDYASGTGRDLGELNEKYSLITRSTSSYQSIADQFSGILPATSAGFLEQAQSAGILSDEYTKLSEVPIDEYQQAVTEMLAKGVDSLNLTGNTAREAEHTISGSLGMLRASWSNFLTELGKDDADIEARVNELVDSAIAVGENVIPRAATIVSRLGTKVVQSLMSESPKIAQTVTTLLDGITNGGFSRVVEAVRPYAERIGEAAKGIIDRFQPLMPVIGEVADKLGGILLQGLEAATGAFEFIAPIISNIAEHALPALSDILSAVGDAFDAALTIMEPVGTFLGETLLSAVDYLGTGIEQLAEDIESAFSFIAEHAQAAAEFLKDPIGGIGKLAEKAGEYFTGTADTAEKSSKRVKGTGKDYDSLNKKVTKSTGDAASAAAKNMGKVASTASKNSGDAARATEASMKKVASAVSTNTANAASTTSTNMGKVASSTSTNTSKAATSASTNMGKVASTTSTNTSNAASTASSNMSKLSSSVSTQTGNAATSAEKNSSRIGSAWNRSYTMRMDATANTSGAESSMRGLKSRWDGFTVSGSANLSTSSASSTLSDWIYRNNNFVIQGRMNIMNNPTLHTQGYMASGGIIQKHADGFIADRRGRGVNITQHIAGEDGAEAVIPLTNRRYVAPFAETVADFINDGRGNVTITGNTFVVRRDSDIAAIGRAINQEAERQRRAKL